MFGFWSLDKKGMDTFLNKCCKIFYSYKFLCILFLLYSYVKKFNDYFLQCVVFLSTLFGKVYLAAFKTWLLLFLCCIQKPRWHINRFATAKLIVDIANWLCQSFLVSIPTENKYFKTILFV